MFLFLARSLEFAAKGNQDVQEDDRQPSLISAVAAGLLSECSGKAKCMGIEHIFLLLCGFPVRQASVVI